MPVPGDEDGEAEGVGGEEQELGCVAAEAAGFGDEEVCAVGACGGSG